MTADAGGPVHVHGKFLCRDDTKLLLRGVTYGPFPPGDAGEYPERGALDEDFAAMAAAGVNTLRTYTVPPERLLDAAQRHRLTVLVGLPWEQHVAFLDDRSRPRSIERRVREGVLACAGHPAVLAYAVGNEIPAPIVRWHGRRRIERFLDRLYCAAKEEQPGALVTYVNYPSTEYLQLPFLDFVCFNVFLEQPDRLAAYLARLHNIAENRPLVLTELGLDSRRHGLDAQAHALRWQISTAFAGGAAGAFVFSWTDSWHRGGHDIDDWDFGLTDRERQPKPALAAVEEAFAGARIVPDESWPRASIIVCAYNAEATLPECLEGVGRLSYPDYEVIVVDDGSTDRTPLIAAEHDCRVITTKNRGLSAARNAGLAAASGEIVAYLDSDAKPDSDWLTHLVHMFLTTSHAGVGGPNLGFPDDGPVATAVAHAPGGPTHVLVTDTEAEHIPGCNMAFRRKALEELGGFDPQFVAAGDDVDLCWRVRERGLTIGFSPTAVVWHHRRRSVRDYWRQQRGYGKAEALLERKWPERYTTGGHISWSGRIYGDGFARTSPHRRWRIYYGRWGMAPFQSIYGPSSRANDLMPLLPEWYLVILAFGLLSVLGMLWTPLFAAVPVFALAVAAALAQALTSARRPHSLGQRGSHDGGLRAMAAGLYLLQPLARLVGRLGAGLTPWRHRGSRRFAIPMPRACTRWSDEWWSTDARLGALRAAIRATGAAVVSGGEFDRWDLEIRGGPLGAARLTMAAEEHGAGQQLVRYQLSPRLSMAWLGVVGFVGWLLTTAALTGGWPAVGIFGAALTFVVLRGLQECGSAIGGALDAIGPEA